MTFLCFIYLLCVQTLLRKKAAEELKREQERKAEERKRMIIERCGQPKDIENANEGNRFLLPSCLYFHTFKIPFDLECAICENSLQ